jgi:hypothetical protein
MTILSTTSTPQIALSPSDEYQSGACNIGPAEISRRRRAGHIGLGAAVVLLGALVAFDAPPIARLLVALPAAASASGYLQAYLKFCAGFGSKGVYNFGELGQTVKVEDLEKRRADRARATRIGLASAAIGITAGFVAVALPI